MGQRYYRCYDGSILRGLRRLTSCSPQGMLSVAKTRTEMDLPLATTPAICAASSRDGTRIVRFFEKVSLTVPCFTRTKRVAFGGPPEAVLRRPRTKPRNS